MEEEFYPLKLPMMKFNNPEFHQYRIYKNQSEYEVVEAASANEALEKSGIDKPYKIIFVNEYTDGTIIYSNMLIEVTEEKDNLAHDESEEPQIEQERIINQENQEDNSREAENQQKKEEAKQPEQDIKQDPDKQEAKN